MSTKSNLIVFGVAALAIVGVTYYAKNKVAGFIPGVVKEGIGAGMLLTGEAFHMLTNPLDAFGIVPQQTGGKAYWTKTTPWENPNDPVSNNDSGINFNYF